MDRNVIFLQGALSLGFSSGVIQGVIIKESGVQEHYCSCRPFHVM
jgi:hypothetical protein